MSVPGWARVLSGMCSPGRGHGDSERDLRRKGRGYDFVHEGPYDENVDVWKQVTLIGGGADVVTVRAADASDYVRGMSWGDGYVSKDCSDLSGVNSGCDRGGHGRSCGEFLFQHLPYKIHKFTNTRGGIIIYFALIYSIL